MDFQITFENLEQQANNQALYHLSLCEISFKNLFTFPRETFICFVIWFSLMEKQVECSAHDDKLANLLSDALL